MHERSRWSSVLATFLLTLAGCSSSAGTAPLDGGDDAKADTGKTTPGHDSGAHDAASDHDAGTTHDAAKDSAIDVGATDAKTSVDAWSVPPGCNPIAVVSTECMLPYPSDFLTVADSTTATGLRMALPQGSLVVPDASTPIDMTPFNLRDGAPTSAPILVHFGVQVADVIGVIA